MKSLQKISFSRLLCIFTLFLIGDVNGKDDIQEEGKILYDLKNITGDYAYNISTKNVIFAENFYSNIMNGTFGEFTIINKLFESLIYKLSMSIMVNNYYKSTFEATTLNEAEYFSESAKDIYLEYKEKEIIKPSYILINNENYLEENKKVKFFHFVKNCFLKINSITYEIKKYVQNFNEIEANNFDIENISMSMTSKLMNELYIHLMTVRDKKLNINEEDLKIVEFIERILQHLENTLKQKRKFKTENIESIDSSGSNENFSSLRNYVKPVVEEEEIMKSPIKNIIEISKIYKETCRIVYNLVTQLRNSVKFSKNQDNYLNISAASLEIFFTSTKNFVQILKNSTTKSINDDYQKNIETGFLKIVNTYNDYMENFISYDNEVTLTSKRTNVMKILHNLSALLKKFSEITDKIINTFRTLKESHYTFSIESTKRFAIFIYNSTNELFNIIERNKETDFEIFYEMQNLQKIVNKFTETENRRRELYESRIPIGQYTLNIINYAAYLMEKFYSNIKCTSNNSELRKLFHSILLEMKNSIIVINNYKLILSTDNERQAKYIAKETKNFVQMTIENEQFESCHNNALNLNNNLNYTSKNFIQIQFFHDVVNFFSTAKIIIEKTKNNVENYLGLTEDILHYESLCLSIVSFVLSEFRTFLETIEAIETIDLNEFDISENNIKVVKFMNDVLQLNQK
ncbi:uncharacterized protein PFB0145c-like [Leptopilina heterotoma]|uniref:uncharacterized protein PFB0145c-like n=1 Tax=Leptopilina heterotoma TaxID=63436 RepID=UPI001CA965F9|nr:uncharacterized protein PFB0145c-like [Leptopilina heterotoma]